MITDFLLGHRWVTPTMLVAMVAVGPYVGAQRTTRPRLAFWLACVSTIPIALLTLVPVNRQLFERCTAQWSIPTPGRAELMANVVLLVAPALLSTLTTRRPLRMLLVWSAASAGIEALQAAITALGRSCNTNDWLANSIGAGIGVTLGWTALRIARVPPEHRARR